MSPRTAADMAQGELSQIEDALAVLSESSSSVKSIKAIQENFREHRVAKKLDSDPRATTRPHCHTYGHLPRLTDHLPLASAPQAIDCAAGGAQSRASLEPREQSDLRDLGTYFWPAVAHAGASTQGLPRAASRRHGSSFPLVELLHGADG